MDCPPYTWRADGGYLPPSTPPEAAQPPPPYQVQGCPFPCPVQGPIGFHGYITATGPPPPPYQGGYYYGYPQPGPKADVKPLPCPPKPPKKDDEKNKKKEGAKKKEKQQEKVDDDEDNSSSTTSDADTSFAPPSLRPGVNYFFPPKKEHTMLHIFNKAAPIWTEKYRMQTLVFKIFKVYTSFTVRKVIEKTIRTSEEENCKAWAMTEVKEKGNGEWLKGTTIEWKDDKSKGTLASMGWSNKNGKELPPVWLVIHKVD